MPHFSFRSALPAFLLPALLCAQTPPNSSDRKVEAPTSTGKWVFSLMPNSMNKNAQVGMTVFGEVTAAGAATPPPSAQSPIYYVAQSGGFRSSGDSSQSKMTPDQEGVANHVKKSLGVAGYLPADEKHPPALFIVFHWGSDYGNDPTSLLRRATVIAGPSFSKELADVMKQQREFQITQSDSARPAREVFRTSADNAMPLGARRPAAPAAFGTPVNLAIAFRAFSPVERFTKENEDNETLLDQAQGGIYYVIISAYDYAATSKNQRVLLWRTRMTVDDSGVSFKDTLPSLLASAGPYLGRDTGRAGTLSKKMLRRGTVEIGPATIIENQAPGKNVEKSAAPKP